MKYELIATSTFGLEAVVKREIEDLGYKIIKSENGKITYIGDERAIARSNISLRCADRVLIKLGEFQAIEFEDLFQGIKGIPLEEIIPTDGNIIVTASSVKSILHSEPAIQRITKKAIIERLKESYGIQDFNETGATYKIKVSILKNLATVTLDTTGAGLHKRGYRIRDVKAPIKETLAAGLVKLSFWKDLAMLPDAILRSDDLKPRPLVDLCAGSGTILIEAAMMARNIMPGANRDFTSMNWHIIDQNIWEDEFRRAKESEYQEGTLDIQGFDIEGKAISVAKANAKRAGVDKDIFFHKMNMKKFTPNPKKANGIIITNPPYGERLGKEKDLMEIYKHLDKIMNIEKSWSIFFITSIRDIEKLCFSREADRRRKLYNGRIEATYYQFHGTKKERSI